MLRQYVPLDEGPTKDGYDITLVVYGLQDDFQTLLAL